MRVCESRRRFTAGLAEVVSVVSLLPSRPGRGRALPPVVADNLDVVTDVRMT